MKTIKYKTIPFDGWKLGKEYAKEKLVAVPFQKLPKNKDEVLIINTEEGQMQLSYEDKFKYITCRTFKDKWGRGDYTLFYFYFKPEEFIFSLFNKEGESEEKDDRP